MGKNPRFTCKCYRSWARRVFLTLDVSFYVDDLLIYIYSGCVSKEHYKNKYIFFFKATKVLNSLESWNRPLQSGLASVYIFTLLRGDIICTELCRVYLNILYECSITADDRELIFVPILRAKLMVKPLSDFEKRFDHYLLFFFSLSLFFIIGKYFQRCVELACHCNF